MNVVASDMCPFCDCDPCDCDWGLNELFKTWNTGVYKTLVNGLHSGSCVSTFRDLELPDFDSLYRSLGTGVPNDDRQYYPTVMVDLSIYKVGDLVNWHPFFGLCDFNKIWLIKSVLPQDSLNCSYHDYEITDGIENHFVTFNELRKLEK